MADILKNNQYDIYTKSGACQFRIQKLRDVIGQDAAGQPKTKEAWHLFVEAANSLNDGTKKCDWDHKISMKLSTADLGILLNGIRLGFKGINPRTKEPMKFELYHDPGKGTATEGQKVKTMGIQPGSSYGYQMYFRQTIKADGDAGKVNVLIPIGDEQMVILKILLEQAVVMINGFTSES